jgi:predicted nucleic acid-binding protein
MTDVISNTSHLLYLYRIEAIQWLPELFSSIWIPGAVEAELLKGKTRGYDVPVPDHYEWLQVVNPHYTPPESGLH